MKTSLSTRLKVLSALFNSLCIKRGQTQASQQPTVLVMENTMQLYRIIAGKYFSSPDVMEVSYAILQDLLIGYNLIES